MGSEIERNPVHHDLLIKSDTGDLMSEQLAIYVLSGLGIVLLPLAVIIMAVKGSKNQVVTWRGFGVVFEIKPCSNCRIRRATDRPSDL